MFSQSKHEEFALVMDIQSGLVRGALVHYVKGQNPHILYIGSRPIAYKKNVDSAYLIKMMIKAVEEVATLIAGEGYERAKPLGFKHPHIHTIHYVFSSPWIISEAKTVKIEYDQETDITRSLIDSIISKEHANLIKKYKEGNLDPQYEFNLAFVEQKIFEVRLNGYSIEDYNGKKARKLEISFAVSLSSKQILDRIHQSIEKIIHAKKEVCHSALLLHYIALRSLIPLHKEYISLHVHGELTDIVIVKEGISASLASFPFGTATLVRKMAADFKNSEEMSDSILSVYEDGKLEENEKQRVERIVGDLLKGWQIECLNTLRSAGEKTLLPRLIYLSVHSHFQVFKNALRGTQFEVIAFDDGILDTALQFEKKSERSPLMGMYALALKDVL